VIAKDPSPFESSAKIKGPLESVQQIILYAEAMGNGCREQRRSQEQDLVGHLQHAYLLWDKQKLPLSKGGKAACPTNSYFILNENF
jgi:hypothetical protein